MKQMTISISSRLALTAAAFGAAIFLYAAAVFGKPLENDLLPAGR